jgi:hypothetical protein
MKTMSKPQDKQDRNLQQGTKEKITGGNKTERAEDGKDDNLSKEEARLQNKSDTAPDEFIAPDADTDQPLDDGIVNDATLRGEDHQDDNIDNLEAKLRNIELNKEAKKG